MRSITFLVKLQLWNRWSTDSNADLHRQHQYGPIQPFLIKLSQVFILFDSLSQLKQIILSGMRNFQILTMISSGLLVIEILAISSYIKLDFTVPVDLLNIHTRVSGVLLIQTSML